jgi:Fe/S biogenesis protein NfuA
VPCLCVGVGGEELVGEGFGAGPYPRREILVVDGELQLVGLRRASVDDSEPRPAVHHAGVDDELTEVPPRTRRHGSIERAVFDGIGDSFGVGSNARDRDSETVGGGVTLDIHEPDGSLLNMSPLEAMASTPATTGSEPIITVTSEALQHLLALRDEEPDGDQLGLRLGIASQPGEEFRYDLSFEEFLKAAFADEVRTHDGLKVVIPGDDVELLTGATLDYTSTQGLVIRNLNKPAAPSVDGLVNDDELSAEVEAMVATEVNPALAAHGGFVTYVGHDGEGTAYMTMGGGCHGCSMSKMTMLDGVQTMLSEAIDDIEKVRDLTDHSTGENPFYS